VGPLGRGWLWAVEERKQLGLPWKWKWWRWWGVWREIVDITALARKPFSKVGKVSRNRKKGKKAIRRIAGFINIRLSINLQEY
jgi:hypothetical protein